MDSTAAPEPGSSQEGPTPTPATALVDLDRGSCLELLAATGVGRVAVSLPDWPPVIRPINYVFDGRSQSVLFRSGRGSKLHALLRAGQAAFEIDGVAPDGRTAWSVIVVGFAEDVTGPAEIVRLEALGLQSWVPGPKPHWVRIRANTVSGRRIAIARGPGVDTRTDRL